MKPWEWTADEPVPPEPIDLSGLDVPGWYEDAVCQDADPDAFFPERGEPNDAALALCRTCPVQRQCLDYALWDLGPQVDYGIWGATSQRQRRALRNPRAEVA